MMMEICITTSIMFMLCFHSCMWATFLDLIPCSGTDVDYTDDIGMDLTELQTLSGFLMNETPDSSGHFYPPWTGDTDSLVKGEPVLADLTASRPQHPASVRSNPIPSSDVKADVSLVENSTPDFSPKLAGGTGSTLRKTAGGGVTRRRSSSKEEQAKKRRERNRVLARRTRLRKKFFFQSLQQQVCAFVCRPYGCPSRRNCRKG